MKPLPIIAPINACVVEIGNPVIVARITVAPAPSATEKRKYSEATIRSGTRPLPENLVSSSWASAIEQIEPAKVAIVANPSAVR